MPLGKADDISSEHEFPSECGEARLGFCEVREHNRVVCVEENQQTVLRFATQCFIENPQLHCGPTPASAVTEHRELTACASAGCLEQIDATRAAFGIISPGGYRDKECGVSRHGFPAKAKLDG
jgi:hypothetical protein